MTFSFARFGHYCYEVLIKALDENQQVQDCVPLNQSLQSPWLHTYIYVGFDLEILLDV